MASPPQMIADWIGLPAFPPPLPKKGTQYADGPVCWLCGGETQGIGWPLAKAISLDTFTNHDLAKSPQSDTVCQACAMMLSSEGWARYVDAYPGRGFLKFFPEKEGKKPRQFNWLYSSHLFALGRHEGPGRKQWREHLLNPPEPPFAFVLAVSGKKHLAFRAVIATNRDTFPILFEETPVFIVRERFARLLADFERLYNLGFSKDSIVSGQYHHGQMQKVGLAIWREAEKPMSAWRALTPQWLSVAHFVAQREDN